MQPSKGSTHWRVIGCKMRVFAKGAYYDRDVLAQNYLALLTTIVAPIK